MTSRLEMKMKRCRPPNEEVEKGSGSNKMLIELKNKKMFIGAIASAQKHNINLEPGRENQGHGNCSYEAVIININDRNCFKEKFLMSLQHYRIIWNTDLMNKILDKKIP